MRAMISISSASVRVSGSASAVRVVMSCDMRRTGAGEAIAGDAQPAHLAHAMGNALSASNALFATYVPVNVATLRRVATARRLGRSRLR